MRKIILQIVANFYALLFGFYADDLYSEKSNFPLSIQVGAAIGLCLVSIMYVMENKRSRLLTNR